MKQTSRSLLFDFIEYFHNDSRVGGVVLVFGLPTENERPFRTGGIADEYRRRTDLHASLNLTI